MGNQVRSIEARLGWLGGIIDGEGTITATSNKRSKRQKNPFGQIQPKITMWNTDNNLIEEYMSILDEIGTTYYVFTQKPRANNLGKKVCFRVEIHGLKRMVKVLPTIIPYLIAKKQKGIDLLLFCESRLATPPNTPYSDMEISIVNRVREVPLLACAET